MRLYYSSDGYTGLHLPIIEWRDNLPSLLSLPISQDDELIEVDARIEETDQIMIAARILDVLNGDLYRRIQQALVVAAREAG